MTLLIDSGALVTALSPDQSGHDDARRALERESARLIISPFVLAEIDYFLLRYGGVDRELRFLAEVAADRYSLAPFDAADVAEVADVIERYRDQNVGLADASIVVLAGRHDTNRVLTLDERHFRTLLTPSGEHFTILPADA